MNEFYVYGYFRQRSSKSGEIGTPYYIGKGKGNRCFSRKSHNAKPPKNPDNNRIILDNLTEEEAFAEEIKLIKLYGRIDLGTGCLRNRTDGGEGVSGHIHSGETKVKIKESRKNQIIIHSEETRRKISEAHKGKPLSKEHIENSRLARLGMPAHNKGIPMSEEQKLKLSLAKKGQIPWCKGKHLSEKHRENISLCQKGKILSEKTRLKISLSTIGKIISVETKLKMSLSAKNRSEAYKLKRRETIKNRTHCKKGHEYTLESVYFYKNSKRCKICINNRKIKYKG